MLIICSSQVFPKYIAPLFHNFLWEKMKKKLAVPYLIFISYSIKCNLEAEDQP